MLNNIKYIVVWLLVFPLSAVTFVLFFILKFLVCVCATIFRKELVPLKSMDYIVIGLLGKDFCPPKADNFNIGFTCKFEGNVDSKRFFQNFKKHVINVNDPTAKDDSHIRFHQNIEKFCGYWFFKTFATINYCNHVTCISIDGASSTFQEEICAWLKLRYKSDCPLWGMLFLYQENTNETHFAFKIHHVLADGYTLMHILDLMTNTSYHYQVKEFSDTKLTKLVILKEAAYNLLQYTRKLYQMPKSYSANIIRSDDQIKSNMLFVAFASLPLSIIQNIRRKADVNFASVILCLINGCVKDLLVEYFDKKYIRKIPEYNIISNTLPWPKHPRSLMCNHFTAGTFKFDLKRNCTSTKKLKSVDEEFKGFHKKHLHRIIHAFWKLLTAFPDCVMSSRFLHNGTIDRVTTSYVHLTGSHHYDTVMGIPCKDVRMFCLLPSKINQIVVTCLTTSEEVRIVVGGSNSIFPTQEDTNRFFQKSFQKNLEELAQEWLGK